MDTVYEMKIYIEKTKLPEPMKRLPYELNLSEIQALHRMVHTNDEYGAMILAFAYGQAKGYRMAKNEEKRKRANVAG